MSFQPDESAPPALPGSPGAVAGGGAQPAPPVAGQIFGSLLPVAQRYADLLAGDGVARGLIGPAEAARIWDRHLLNSAVVAEFIPADGTLADLGSGAGLPGVVLAILRPRLRVILVEPMLRRTEFLAECVRELGLANAEVLRGRAEELSGRVGADVVTARAVAVLSRLAGMAVGLARPGGTVLAIKGSSAAAELADARPVLARLGIAGAEVVTAGAGLVSPPATVVRLTLSGGSAR